MLKSRQFKLSLPMFNVENSYFKNGFITITAVVILLLFVLTISFLIFQIRPFQTHPKLEQKTTKKIAVLTASDTQLPAVSGIKSGLVELGLKENGDYTIEVFNPKGDKELAKSLALQILDSNPDLIVPVSTTATKAILEARANRSIPIVFVDVGNLKEIGIKDSHHPGSLVTGVASDSVQFADKRMELLLQAVPNAKIFGVLYNPNHISAEEIIRVHEEAASKLVVKIKFYQVDSEENIEKVLSQIKKDRPDGVLTSTDSLISTNAKKIAESMRLAKIPTIDFNAEMGIKSGYLMMFGALRSGTGNQGSRLIAKILRGETTENIPIEYSLNNKLELNTALAEEFNLIFPESLIIRAAD